MSLAIQTESSNASQALTAKRKRGRPRKDRSLNQMGVSPVPPGFERLTGSRSRQSNKVDDKDGMVGQEVTGVIEASFDAGYLLAVRVGNSRTILRGVVFKPGHYAPVTSHNDVAPGAQMINRAAVNLPLHNQTPTSLSSIDRNGLYRSSPQSATVISKGKSVSLTAGPIITQVGARGTVVPVVLQPLGPFNGAPPANSVNMDASVSDGKDVVAAEPLAMFIPQAASASARQFQVTTNQPVPIQVQVQAGSQLPAGSAPTETDYNNSNNNKVPSVMKEVAESQELNQTSAPTLEESAMASHGSSESSEMNLDDDDDDDSSAGTSNTESDQEVAYPNSSSVPNLSTHPTTGRMTELLQALQENYENQKSRPVPLTNSGSNSQEKENSEINPGKERLDG